MPAEPSTQSLTDTRPLTRPQVAALIDHTLLKPEATSADIERICAEAVEFQFASVCVNPVWAPQVAAALAGSPVKTCTVIGFPLGANQTETKVAESQLAMRDGAQELDMVLSVGHLRAGALDKVASDIQHVAQVCRDGGAILKVILETCLLTDEQKRQACQICVDAGAHFVKTSTGFGSGGATTADIALMRGVVGPDLGVKASGGIRTLEQLLGMVQAGASRVGASASVAIVRSLEG